MTDHSSEKAARAKPSAVPRTADSLTDIEMPIEVDHADSTHIQQHEKPFTMWSAAALGYSTTNTGAGMLLVVGNAVFGAGPLFIYGTLVVAAVGFCVAVSLGELASAYPHAGGQYFWVARLAPPRYRRFLSYLTGIISWASVVCISASCSAGSANVTAQLVAVLRPDFEFTRWMMFLVFQAANFLAVSFNLFERTLPGLMKICLFYCVAVVVIFVVGLLAPGSSKAAPGVVFGAEGYYNTSGWPDGLAFILGLSGLNWGFSCLDAAVHLAEEIPQPRKNIPKSLLITVILGLGVALLLNITIFFVAIDIPNTTSIISVLDAIYPKKPAVTVGIGATLLGLGLCSGIGIHTWMARIAWALSRDQGFPFSSRLQRLAPRPFSTPLWAHLWCTVWAFFCGLLYLGSETAFNSFISASIILQFITYTIPIFFVLWAGRENFAHGPFWWPRVGLIANVVVILYTFTILVLWSFPLYYPVDAAAMNYVSAVLAFSIFYVLGYWFLTGRKHYRLVELDVDFD